MSESKYDESKEEDSKEVDGDDALSDLDPIVEAFLNFSYSSSLGDIADSFVKENAEEAGFSERTRYDESGEGHPLSWSQLHREYCERIDCELTSFCSDNGVAMNELFEKLEEVLETNKHVADALPGFVKLTSYEHFCSQMESQATLAQIKEEAEDLGGGEMKGLLWWGGSHRCCCGVQHAVHTVHCATAALLLHPYQKLTIRRLRSTQE